MGGSLSEENLARCSVSTVAFRHPEKRRMKIDPMNGDLGSVSLALGLRVLLHAYDVFPQQLLGLELAISERGTVVAPYLTAPDLSSALFVDFDPKPAEDRHRARPECHRRTGLLQLRRGLEDLSTQAGKSDECEKGREDCIGVP
jgi:hypothetical protein